MTGAIAGRRRRLSWKDSYDAYLQSQRLELDRSPETLKAYESAWLEFTEHLSSRASLEDVPQAIARYREVLRKRRLKENTIALRLTAVHSYFKWCLDTGVTRDDPLYRLKLPRKTYNPRSVPTSVEMARALRKLSSLPRLDRLIIAVATNAGKTSTTSSKPAAPDNTTAGAAAPATKPPAKAPVVLLDLAGSGTKSTQKFTAAGDWDLDWSYDCTTFAGGSGNFQVYIYNGDGSLSSNGLVNQLGKSGTSVEHYHTGGTIYLQMNSECTWHVTVKG